MADRRAGTAQPQPEAPEEGFRVAFLPEGVESQVPRGSTLLQAAASARLAIDSPCGHRGTCGKCRVQVVEGTRHQAPGERETGNWGLGTGTGGGSSSLQSPVPSRSAALGTQHSARETHHSSLITHHFRGLEPPTLTERSLLSAEELAEGWRLACQARVRGEVAVRVPERSLQPAVVPLSEIHPRPFVRKMVLRVPEPTLQDPASDLTRLRRALAGEVPDLKVGLPLIRRLPERLGSSARLTAVVAGDRLIALEPGETSGSSFGLAVDLGTTSVVTVLADLANGRVLGTESRLNGQANYGADVISRITYAASDPRALEDLQSAAVATINAALDALLERTSVDRRHIYEAVVVGNSCMSHLLLGIDPSSLGRAPYQPAVTDPVSCRAADLGLTIHPEGIVYTLPNIAGFVGSDTVAVILATGMHRSEEVLLALDLGTNGEIVLGNRDRLIACSTAAGPAFEGARISQGMRAAPGAIERVWIEGGRVKLRVIGGTAAAGICGSGLLDAVAQMRRAGLLNETGRVASEEGGEPSPPSALSRRLVQTNGTRGFVLSRGGRRPVLLTQSDVRELQLAKGAIRAGISILLEEYGIGEGDISEVLLAGAFGSYLSPASARAIGLIPPLSLDRVTAVGNAAGQGAVMALLSTDLREEAVRIARSTEYVELSARSDFMNQFMEAMALEGPERSRP